MTELNNNTQQLEINTQSNIQNKKVVKHILSWLIHNIKFIFIPGYNLEDLAEQQIRYESMYSKKHNLKRYKSAFFYIGIIIILFLITLAVLQDWISPYPYQEAISYHPRREWYLPPSPEHPLGQTFIGTDILARLIFGARPVLIFTLSSTGFALIIGIIIGAISAYYGGWLDTLVMRVMDIILSFPGVVFAVILITIWGSSFILLIIIYTIIGIPYFTRLIRTSVLKEKELPYINAGRVAGAKNFRIIFRHILPNSIQPVIIAASFNISRNILSLAVLGFLRLGGIGWIEWGNDIALAIYNIFSAPWAGVYPTLMILISVLGFLLLGDSLNDLRYLTREAL